MAVDLMLPQAGFQSLRRWPRYKVDLPVSLIVERPTKFGLVQGRGRDLNLGGMAVVAGVELSMHEQVAVEFTPPCSGQSIRVRGFVRNRNACTYGIEFVTENDADYKNVGLLESILQSLSTVN